MLRLLLLYQFWYLHMLQTPSHLRRDAWHTNCTPKDAHASVFSIFPVLHTQVTFALVLNFDIGHFARDFLLLSFFLLALLWKEFNSQGLRCHISFLSFVRLTACFLSSRGRLLDSRKRRPFRLLIRGSLNKFRDFFRMGTFIDSTRIKLQSLRSNLLRLQCTCCTVPTTSRRPHGSPLVWACQWPPS